MDLGCPSRVKKPAVTATQARVSQFLLIDTDGGVKQGLTGPGGVQPVLDVEDLLVFGARIRLLTDLIVFGDFFLRTKRLFFSFQDLPSAESIRFQFQMDSGGLHVLPTAKGTVCNNYVDLHRPAPVT